MPRKKPGAGPAKPSGEFEKEWATLRESFHAFRASIENGLVQDSDEVNRKLNAYTVVYQICTKLHSNHAAGNVVQETLYKHLRTLVEEHLTNNVVKRFAYASGDALLAVTVAQWAQYKLIREWITFAFKFLDQNYTTSPIIDATAMMATKCFNTAIFVQRKESLRGLILKNVEKDRSGETVERAALKDCVGLFLEMCISGTDVYGEMESYLVPAAREYYKKEASSWLSASQGRVTYLKKVEARIQDEVRRGDSLFTPATTARLRDAVEEAFLHAHSECLSDNEGGAAALLSAHKCEDLGRMYRLFHTSKSSMQTMAVILKDFIIQEGITLNMSFATAVGGKTDGEAASTVYIKGCLALHKKYEDMLRSHFDNNPAFIEARAAAFKSFLNPPRGAPHALKQKNKLGIAEEVSPGEMLSTYVDSVMKKEAESEAALEQFMESTVELLMYFQNKDTFSEFYMSHVSKRLLYNKNHILLDQERRYVSQLKVRNGTSYTSKFEGMLADQDKSDMRNRQFKVHCDDISIRLPVDFSVLILTGFFWPAYKQDTLQPPPEIMTCITHYKDFYNDNTQSRKLSWVHSLGQATLQKKFPKGPPREISVSAYQACVLLLFNEGSVVASAAARVLKLPFEEVKRCLHSLAFGKFPVIKRSDGKPVKQVREEDQFEVC